MADVSDLGVSAEQTARQARRLGMWARVVLVPVAVIGAVLSFRSLYLAAVPTFGEYLAAGFPLLVDLLILGASLQYVAGAKIGRPMAGWRLTAHAGVGGTLILNALAANELGQVPWHITAPAVWAVLVELTAKQVLGEWKATHTAKADTISLPLWMTAPIESVRTRLLMFRTGITNAHQARIAVGVNAAAREALRLALPRWNARRVRRIINRQLRAGSLTPVAILRPLGWTKGGVVLNNARPDVILQAVLQEVLDPGSPPAPIATAAPTVARSEPAQPQPQPAREFEPPVRESEPPVREFEPPVREFEPQVREFGPPVREFAQPRATSPPTGPIQRPTVPGRVQQPDRALELGRALHRGRVLHETGSSDTSATAAEQLRSALTRIQTPAVETPRFEPAQYEPEQAARPSDPVDLFQQPTRPAQPPRATAPFPPTGQIPRIEQPAANLAPTAVMGLDATRQLERPNGTGRFDEAEILQDMEHLDDLDGQGYPDEFDGLEESDYIDLDDPARQGEPVPRRP
jgi:hypothetical protein